MSDLSLKTASHLLRGEFCQTLLLGLLRGIQLLYAQIALRLPNISVLPRKGLLGACEVAVYRSDTLLLRRRRLLAALRVFKSLLAELGAELGLSLRTSLLIFKSLLAH